MRKVRAAIWGFGAMGSGMAKVLVDKKGIDVVAVCDRNKARVGRSMYEVLGVDRGEREEVILDPDLDKVLDGKNVDVMLVCTDSFTAKTAEKIEAVVKKGINVISTAEEMAFPMAKEPEISKKLDELAKANGVSILGTGINPGLMMDLLVACISGACTDVKSLKAERVNSLSPFGKAVMVEQGVGVTVEEFEKGCKDGTLSGHVGFRESIYMIDKALGLGVDQFEQQMKPIVTDVDRKSAYGFAKKGDVAGVRMSAQGLKNGEVIVDMLHPQQIEPQLGGTETGDYITIKGTPNVSMAIQPEIDGGIGTIAMCINMIPQVINASPGLKTMIDLPVPRAIMGDYRDQIEVELK